MDSKQSDQQTNCGQTGQNGIKTIENSEPSKISYPKRVFLILSTEFCERYTFYGVTAILSIYLNEKLGYTEDDASALYHGFIMMVYLMCIFGGFISDIWLGKFKTIFILSIVDVFGCAAVSISAIPTDGISPKVVLIVGLLLIATGGGGIKPCVCTFGGDQFKIPGQATQLATFFSVFYFATSIGSVMTTIITPILRSDVHCFGDSDCYSLAFGVPAVLMIVAIVFFLVGKPSYKIGKISSENMIVQVTKCVSHAISTKIREGRSSSHKKLLDYSIDKYGDQLVEDIRILLRILVLYLPLPIFWTLFEQRGSRWTFQAKQMNGNIGFYTIQPDQIQMMNPLLVLIMIPLFESVVYPGLKRFGLRRPLQKMVIGGVLAALSFVIAGIIQFRIETSPKNTVHILWQLPQYFVLTAGEILFCPVGLGFSYEQAPKTMKSVVSAFWQLPRTTGNLITIVIISGTKIFESQSHEFLFFAGLMLVDILIFGVLAYFYKSSVKTEKQLEKKIVEMEITKV